MGLRIEYVKRFTSGVLKGLDTRAGYPIPADRAEAKLAELTASAGKERPDVITSATYVIVPGSVRLVGEVA